MRRILPLTLLALTLLGGVAAADHYRRGGGGGVVVRDHRAARPVVVRERRAVVRQPVYVSNGRYVFAGGVSRAYVRPVIRQRYYDVRIRPTLIVENYDPVPGYVWVRGRWQWNGYEWLWVSGYYAPDTRIHVYYDDGTYE
jgi:hypothetical protein